MKRTSRPKPRVSDELRPEYRFDYAKARPNRFAKRMDRSRVVILEPDVARVFRTPESVNKALRALISAVPKEPS
jgi:hypothetical protein